MKLLLTSTLSLPAFLANACPFCDSKTAADIRSQLFGPDFLFNAGVTVAPFLVVFLITYFIYHGGWKRERTT